MRRIPMHMTDWVAKLDAFLTLNEREILAHAGSVSHDAAVSKAESEYDRFKQISAGDPQPVDDDFDRAAKTLTKLPKPKKPARPKK